MAHFVHRRLFHRLRVCGSRTPRRASAWRLQHRTDGGTTLSWPGRDIRDPAWCGRLLRLHLHLVRSPARGHGCGPVLHRPGLCDHRKTEGRTGESSGCGFCRDGIRVGQCHRQRRNQRGVHDSPHEKGRLQSRRGRGHRGGGKYRGPNPSPDHGGRSVLDRRIYRPALSGGRQGGPHSRDSLHGYRVRLRAPGGGQEGPQGYSILRASSVPDHIGQGLALPRGPGGPDVRTAHGFFSGPGRIPFVPGGRGTGGLASRVGPRRPASSGLEAGRSASPASYGLGRRRDRPHRGWLRHSRPKCASSKSGLRGGGNHRGHRRPHGSGPQVFISHAFPFPGESLSCPDTSASGESRTRNGTSSNRQLRRPHRSRRPCTDQ